MTSDDSPRRREYAPSRRRRDHIAATVLELVDESGHEGITTAEVARRSGVPEASVMYHFATKDHLLVAAMQRADDLRGDDLDGGDPRLDLDDLRRDVRRTVELPDHRARLYAVLRGLSARPDHPASAYVAARTRRAVGVFARLLARRQAEGLAHPAMDPEQVATQVLALWEGLESMRLMGLPVAVDELLAQGIRRLSGADVVVAASTLLGRETWDIDTNTE